MAQIRIAPEIRFQINLPDARNRRFYLFGNGGYAGETADTPPKPLFRDHALAAEFATAWTNAVHLTAVTGKAMAAAYYGRQGLMEAQRFPLDFNGVLAGAPVERFVDSQVVGLCNGLAVSGSGLTLDKPRTLGAVHKMCGIM